MCEADEAAPVPPMRRSKKISRTSPGLFLSTLDEVCVNCNYVILG